MTAPENSKCLQFLLPGEQALECLKLRAFSRPCEFVLTDQRLLVSGYTGALGPSFTLLRGAMVAGFPLTEFESFIVGTGKRPLLALSAIALAVAGAVMLSFAMTRYPGLVVLAFALFTFLAWTAWPRTFVTVSGKGIKISGKIKLCEAIVFLERLQLAASAAKAGKSPRDIRDAVALSGKTPEACALILGDDEPSLDGISVCVTPRPENQDNGPPN
ncbi:MAG TPA: hypothetical protein VM658_01850 [bacterium]|nr:hypothetical protein [bacterium]